MRLYCIAVLLTTVFLATIHAAPEATDARRSSPISPSIIRSIIGNDHVPRSRLLRSNKMQEEEDRAIKLPGKSKFVKWLNPSTESKLPSADVRQIKKWVKNKNSEEDVFKRLELDSGMEKVLSNAKLDTYAAYVDRFNKKNPDNKVSMVDMFTKTYGDDVVARALEVGADAPSTRKIASRLWRELLGSWKHNRDSADDIFKLLKLDEAGTDLFAMPQLNTWFIFTRMTVHDPKEEMVSVLAATYGYDGLSRIFLSATPRDTTMRFIALDLETAMGKMWLSQGLTPDDIFKLLKLDGGVNSFVANPNVKTLSSYIDKFNVNADQPTTLVGVFKNFYGVKRMSEMLDKAKKVPGMETRVDKWKSQLASENLRARRIQWFSKTEERNQEIRKFLYIGFCLVCA